MSRHYVVKKGDEGCNINLIKTQVSSIDLKKMKYTEDDFKRWVEWIEQVQKDLTHLIHYEQIHDGFVKVVHVNFEHIEKNEGMIFCNWVRECYGVQAAMGIRRHVRLKDDNSVSLIRILDQMAKSASQITYVGYLKFFPEEGEEWQQWQKSTFGNLSENGTILSKKIIEQDVEVLKKIDEKIGDFVDKVFAHLDRNGAENKITFGDLKKAIDEFDKIARRYIVLLTGKGYTSSLVPKIQNDWKKIFRVPFDIRNEDDESNY